MPESGVYVHHNANGTSGIVQCFGLVNKNFFLIASCHSSGMRLKEQSLESWKWHSLALPLIKSFNPKCMFTYPYVVSGSSL